MLSQPRNREPLAVPGAPNSITHTLAQILEEVLGMPGLPALTLVGLRGLEEVWAQLRLYRQEGMLRDLQKSVEEEEQVWKAKLTVSEEELQKVRVLGQTWVCHLWSWTLRSRGAVCYKLDGDLNCPCQP